MTDSRRHSFALPWSSSVGNAPSINSTLPPQFAQRPELTPVPTRVENLATRAAGSRASFLGMSLFGKEKVIVNDSKMINNISNNSMASGTSSPACIPYQRPEYRVAAEKQNRFSFYRNSLFRKPTDRNILDETSQRSLVLGKIPENDFSARPIPARKPSVLRKVDQTSTASLPSSVTSSTTPMGIPISVQDANRRERIKKSISEPFGFRHIVHTDPTQANHLQRAFAGVEGGARGARARYDAGTRAYLNRVSTRRSVSLTRGETVGAEQPNLENMYDAANTPSEVNTTVLSSAARSSDNLVVPSSSDLLRATSLRRTSNSSSSKFTRPVNTVVSSGTTPSTCEETTAISRAVPTNDPNTSLEKQTSGLQSKILSSITMARSSSLNRPLLDVLPEETSVPPSPSFQTTNETIAATRSAMAKSLRRTHSNETGRSGLRHSRAVSVVPEDVTSFQVQGQARINSPPRPRRPSDEELQSTTIALANQPRSKGNWDDLIDFCYDEALKPDESPQVMLPSLYAIGAPVSHTGLERKSSERKRKSIGQTGIKKSTLSSFASSGTPGSPDARASFAYRPKRTSSIYSSPYLSTELDMCKPFDSELSSIASETAHTNFRDFSSKDFLAELASDYPSSGQGSCIATSRRISAESLGAISPISSSTSSAVSMTDPTETRPVHERKDSNDSVPELIYSRKSAELVAALMTTFAQANVRPEVGATDEMNDQGMIVELMDDADLSPTGEKPEVPRRSSRRLRLRRGGIEQTVDVPLPIMQSLANAQRLRAKIEAQRAQRMSLCAPATRA